jgi:hypothetical protein
LLGKGALRPSRRFCKRRLIRSPGKV